MGLCSVAARQSDDDVMASDGRPKLVDTGVDSKSSERRGQMSKSTRNTGQPWSPADEKALRDLARGNTPTRVIGLKLGRTEGAVRTKAQELGVSLKPSNQSPYNR